MRYRPLFSITLKNTHDQYLGIPAEEIVMRKILTIFLSLNLWMATTFAEGNLAITKTAQINAPASAVWSKLRDFNALNSWHPAVISDEIIEGENNTVGAVRLLTLVDGGTIKEKLLAWDDAGMSMTYNILEGVLPVSSYVSTLKVEILTDTSSKVTWSSSFNAADGADNKKASDTISGIYEDGLDHLLKIMSSP